MKNPPGEETPPVIPVIPRKCYADVTEPTLFALPFEAIAGRRSNRRLDVPKNTAIGPSPARVFRLRPSGLVRSFLFWRADFLPNVRQSQTTTSCHATVMEGGQGDYTVDTTSRKV
jgi:hypothetical protein